MEEEKKSLHDEIDLLMVGKSDNVTIKENIIGTSTSKFFQDEPEACIGCDVPQRTFSCKDCDAKFSSKNALRKHWTNQMHLFAASIEILMKNEISETKEACYCRRFCNINHAKHNWKKPFSHDIITSFGKLKAMKSENREEKQAVHSGGDSRIIS